MSETFDLDARRAARREAKGEAPRVRFNGNEYTLPLELPLGFSELLVKGRMADAIRLLVGDDVNDWLNAEFTVDDLNDLVKSVYAEPLGESSASIKF